MAEAWPILAAIGAADQARIRARMTTRRFRRGAVVFHQGDPGDSLHLIVVGRFDVQASTPDGQVVTVGVLHPGEFFGELALVTEGARRTGRVAALEDGETLVLHRRDFEELRAELGSVDRVLVAALAHRVEQTTNQVLELLMPLEARVCRRLLALHDGYGGTGIELTQDDIARMAGATRPRVNRVLRSAEAAGVLRLERGRITVTDRAGLERLAHVGG